MSPDTDTLNIILANIHDLQRTVNKMEERLSKDVGEIATEQHRLERQMVRVEAQATVRDEVVMAMKQQMNTFAPREELELRYPTRAELASAHQTKFRFALPLILGILIGLPGYANLLVEALR